MCIARKGKPNQLYQGLFKKEPVSPILPRYPWQPEDGCAKQSRVEEALQLLEEMKDEGVGVLRKIFAASWALASTRC